MTRTAGRWSLRPELMRRHDIGWLEALFCLAVVGGAVDTWVTPARVASVITLSGFGSGHPGLVLSAVVVLTAVVVYRTAVVWGPVRTDPATARWVLSGPDPRQAILSRRLRTASGIVLVALTVVGGVAALLHPASLPNLLVVSVSCGAIAAGGAYVTQLRADRRRHGAPGGDCGRSGFRWSTNSLHRRTFAPNDAFAGAVGLAMSMMDLGWLLDARVVRWQRAHTTARRVSLRATPAVALVQLDLRRLLRHPDALVRLAASVVAGVMLAAVFAVVPTVAPEVVAVLTFCAGNSVASGLREVAAHPGIVRGLGRSDAFVRLAHAVVPTAAVVIAAAVLIPAWHLGIDAAAILVTGAGLAVWRRATRPPLPYDAAVVMDPLHGTVVQPQLALTQLRGIIAIAVTAALMALV